MKNAKYSVLYKPRINSLKRWQDLDQVEAINQMQNLGASILNCSPTSVFFVIVVVVIIFVVDVFVVAVFIVFIVIV